MGFFQFYPEPNQNIIKPPIVKITKNVSKNKKKPKMVTVTYNVNELNKVKVNSKKMKDELIEVKRRAKNMYLSQKQQRMIEMKEKRKE